MYFDACIDVFGASLVQEQPNGSVRPTAYIRRVNLDSERYWNPLDVEAGSIVWAIKCPRGYLWSTKFRIFPDRKALKRIGKVGNHNARVQRWLEFLTASDYTLEYRKGSANGNADFLSGLPEPATEHDRSGSSSLTPVDPGLRASHSFLSDPRAWVGWCSAPRALLWVGSLSPLRIVTIFARTSHV